MYEWAQDHNLRFRSINPSVNPPFFFGYYAGMKNEVDALPEVQALLSRPFGDIAWAQIKRQGRAFFVDGEFNGVPILAMRERREVAYGHKNKWVHLNSFRAKTPFSLDLLTIQTSWIDNEKDIDFESEEFNRNFNIKSWDKRSAFDIIHTRTMELLLKHRGDLDGLEIVIAGSEIDVSQFGRFTRAQLDAILEVTTGIINNIPDYLRKGRRR